MTEIERAFVRIREGQVHLRRNLPEDSGEHTPLVMLHSSPVASGSLVPLMRALGPRRPLIAPDTLGNGDSAPPDVDEPNLAYFADAVIRLMDELDLGQIDLYGVRTGGLIASEIAVAKPELVRRMVLDEVNLPAKGSMERALVENPPKIDADDMGRHLLWAWHVIRDHSLFYPWFLRDGVHRLDIDLPPADALHDGTVEVLKALRTFHFSYQAAFRYPRHERFALIRVPTLVLADPTHLASKMAPEVARLIPTATLRKLRPNDDKTVARARAIDRFLSRSPRHESREDGK